MSAATVFTAKRPMWLRVTAMTAVVSIVVFLALSWMAPWQPGRVGGLTYGIVAALLFTNAGLYPLRRRLGAWPLGRAQRWLQLHIYGSSLAMLLVFIHVGFRLPAGLLGWWLLLLALWTTATGLLGVFLQKWVPLAIAHNLKTEAIYERIPEIAASLSSEATEVVSGAGATLRKAYDSDVQPLLATVAPRWAYVFDLRGPRARKLERLISIEPFIEEQDRERFRDLTTIVNEKLDLDAHASLQRVLRLWVHTHVPAAMVLLGLLVVHVFAVVYY